MSCHQSQKSLCTSSAVLEIFVKSRSLESKSPEEKYVGGALQLAGAFTYYTVLRSIGTRTPEPRLRPSRNIAASVLGFLRWMLARVLVCWWSTLDSSATGILHLGFLQRKEAETAMYVCYTTMRRRYCSLVCQQIMIYQRWLTQNEFKFYFELFKKI